MKFSSWHILNLLTLPPKTAFLIENECIVLTFYWNLIAIFQKTKLYAVIDLFSMILCFFAANLNAENVGKKSTVLLFTQF